MSDVTHRRRCNILRADREKFLDPVTVAWIHQLSSAGSTGLPS